MEKTQRRISIAVSDDNVFFTSGLKHYFDEYASNKHLTISCSDSIEPGKRYDVIFLSLEQFYSEVPQSRELLFPCSRLVVIAGRLTEKIRFLLPETIPVLFRHASVYEQSDLFEQLFSPAQGPKILYYRRDVSFRERQVLLMLAKGIPQTVIAEVLNVTVKTVSTHKSNVMNRLKIYDHAVFAAWFTHHIY